MRSGARYSIPSSSCLRENLVSRSDFHFRRRGTKRGQSLLDRFIDVPLGGLRSHPHRILDGVGVRGTVRNNAYASYPQQRRATVFGVVDALLEIGKGAA